MHDFTRPWCYWLDETQVHPEDLLSKNPRFRVCIVFAHESGFFPTGDTDRHQEPWWWTKDICKAENLKKLGLSERAVTEIVSHSMASQMKEQSKRGRRGPRRASAR